MQVMTKKAIQKLLKDTSRKLVVEDFELFSQLDKIADKVAGVSVVERRLLSQPYELCGLKFYPMTVAKSLWVTEKVDEWGLDGTYQETLLFWLLTLPNLETAFDAFDLQKDAHKAVKRLSRKLHCTNDEMTAVYNKCLGIREEPTGAGGTGEEIDTDYGGIIAVLLREYGGTPDKWLYESPVEMISALFKAYSDKVNAESSGGGSNGGTVAPVFDAKMQALKDFREKVNAISAQWETEDGE